MPRLRLFAILFVLLITPAHARSATVVVELKELPARRGSREDLAVRSAFASHGALNLRPFFAGHTGAGDPLARFQEADVAPGSNPDDVTAALRFDPRVASVTADVLLPFSACVPGDPFFAHSHPDSAQWPLDRNPSGPDLDALEAWNVTTGDRDVVIAILDSGVDWRHPDFQAYAGEPGAIVENAAEVNGEAGVDDDDNGFIDDVRGWDFVSVDSIPGYDPARVASGEDAFLPDNDPMDFLGHGTFIAGLIGARVDNDIGMAGAAPAGSILPVRVGWRESPNSGVVSMAFCAKGIVYAADNGARVLNCSWLSDAFPALVSALDYAIGTKGIVVVDAAGNGGLLETQSRNYLSRRGDCIEVAAVNRDGVVAAQSSIGTWVDVSAPGVQLLSTAVGGGAARYRIEPFGATSFAAAFASAAAALVLSVEPELSPAAVRQRLMETATSLDAIPANAPFAGKLGAGLVNLARAVGSAARAPRFAAGSGVALSPAGNPGGGFVFIDRGGTFHRVRNGAIDSTLIMSPAPPSGFASWWEETRELHAVTFRSGYVTVLGPTGHPEPGWPRPTGRPIFGGPVVTRTNGQAVIIAAGSDSTLYAWDRAGRRRPGFPVRLETAAIAQPAVGDRDGDGLAEIVVVTHDGAIEVFDLDGGRREYHEGSGSGFDLPPALADIDGDGKLEIIEAGPQVMRVIPGSPGGPAWLELYLEPAIRTPPVAGDLDRDGRAEVLFVEEPNPELRRLQVKRGVDGASFPGWPVILDDAVSGEPLVVAIDASGTPGVLVTTVSGCLLFFDASGRALPDLTKRADGNLAAPAAAVPGAMAVGLADGGFRVFPRPPGVADYDTWYWTMAGGDAGRTRALKARPISSPDYGPELSVTRASVTPNPSRGPVIFRFTIDEPGAADLHVYDVQGRLVRHVFTGDLPAGVAILPWDGRDGEGRPLASGIYSYVLHSGGRRLTGRLVRIG